MTKRWKRNSQKEQNRNIMSNNAKWNDKIIKDIIRQKINTLMMIMNKIDFHIT